MNQDQIPPRQNSQRQKEAGGNTEIQRERLAALSDQQLKKLARQAKLATAAKQPQERLDKDRANRMRRWRRRIFIWCLELFVLLFVLEIFILGPRRVDRLRREREAREAAMPPPGRGQPLSPLGEDALPMAGLRETVPAYLASLEVLAEGSAEAQQEQLAYARDMQLPVEVENSIGMVMRLVPPGTFTMGSPDSEAGRWEGEKQHRRTVPEPLYFGKFEVTQEQWRQVMGTSPAYFRGDTRPVENVRWEDARRFTRKLAEREGLPPGTYRLPDEVEWEYACRAGTNTAFVFGDNPELLRQFAVYINNSEGRTALAGRFRPNAFGLHDMHGNVWEWCRDSFENYPEVELPDPTEGRWRNVRGGNWREEARDCRSATRTRLPPDSLGNILGFRIVRTIPELWRLD